MRQKSKWSYHDQMIFQSRNELKSNTPLMVNHEPNMKLIGKLTTKLNWKAIMKHISGSGLPIKT